jgi:hypothetical protein
VASPDAAVAPMDGGVIPAGPEPAHACGGAVRLGIDDRREQQTSEGAVPPPPAPESCWSGASRPGAFFELELPPFTGVTVRVERTAGSGLLDVLLADRCAPEAEECRYFYFGFRSPGPIAESYAGNDGDRPLRILAYVSFEDGPVEYTIQTRSEALPRNVTCDQAAPLPPQTWITAGRGGSSTFCGFLREHSFYRISVPPRSQALALDGASFPAVADDCACSGTQYGRARNTSDQSKDFILELEPGANFAWQSDPLEHHASCATAALLYPAGSPVHGQTERAGDEGAFCEGAYRGAPLFFRAQIPPQFRVTFSARALVFGFEQGVQLWAAESCDMQRCIDGVSELGERVSLAIENPSPEIREVWLGAALGYLFVEDNELVVDAVWEDLPR